MTVESCSGGSPWKIDAAGVRAAFSLVDHGISVVGIPEEEVLRMSRRLNDAIVAGKAEALLKAWQKEQQASHQA